jgi:hypothetical protein
MRRKISTETYPIFSVSAVEVVNRLADHAVAHLFIVPLVETYIAIRVRDA